MTAVGNILKVDINREMRQAYLDYAMSVIVSRALPDARDGLKPVHRRILYAMHDMGLRSDAPYKKSARIVGEVLGKYHPHGDQAVYDAMVRMAQPFSMRHPLVDGQGNFGSVDGDSAAAMRYTEARMTSVGADMLSDIGKDTVDFVENFDGTLREPSVLPSAFPNLVVNGATGIAVGMATSIPPHNLAEVCDALVYMLRNWDKLDKIGVPELMRYIKGPDFPTGGTVYRSFRNGKGESEDGLMTAYATGRGKVRLRAKAYMEAWTRGRSRIVIGEIPYQVNKTSLIERIASLARDGKIEGITDLRDESDRQGLRIVIELSRSADPAVVMRELYRLTPLESTFSIIMLALVDGEPRLLSLKQLLKVYLDHRLEIVRRRSKYDLARAEERAHILEGLLIALENLDEAIQTIRRSRTVDTARKNLRKKFSLTDAQAQAILEMPLRRLAALERRKIQEEYKEKQRLIRHLRGLLRSPKKMRQVIIDELSQVREKYADLRRTVIADGHAGDADRSLSAPAEGTWVAVTVEGLLGRTRTDDVPKVTAADRDPPRFLIQSDGGHILYLFTEDGRAVGLPVHRIPPQERFSDSPRLSDLTPIGADTPIADILSIPPGLDGGFLFLVTERGRVKRVGLGDMPGPTAVPFIVMKVGEGDRLLRVLYTTGESDVILTTWQGQAIRFAEADVRPMGLRAGGVRGISLLGQRDKVVGASLVRPRSNLWVIADNGFAKFTPVSEYPSQKRGGKGVIAMKLPRGSNGLAASTVGNADSPLIVLTDRGRAKYMRLGLAPRTGRNATGDRVIALRADERVASVVPLTPRIGAG